MDGQDGPEIDFSGFADEIRAQLTAQSLPSLAVAVARDGHILWEQGFGWADRENRIPATEHTIYSLASISKPFTTTGLMRLVEQGKVDLDRPIDDYLGEAKLYAHLGEAADATVRRVANHTSGLPLHFQFFYADEPVRRPPMDETIRRYGHLVTPPGERCQYSNLGYGLLDEVISRVSGQSYADYMRTQVFLPLGMLRASVDIAPGLEPFQAVRYGADQIRYPFYDFDHPGGSAVYCSAHDLVRFGMFHMNTPTPDQHAILTEASLDAMQTPTSGPNENNGFGIGWDIHADDGGYRTFGHEGGMGGVNTVLKCVPSEKIAVVALMNACSEFPFSLADEILARLLPDYGTNRARQREAGQPKRAQEKPKPFKPDQRLRGRWSGNVYTYWGPIPLTLWFRPSGDIHAQMGTQLKMLINEPRFEDGKLSGKMMGDLKTEDTTRRPSRLALDLTLRDQRLTGAILAFTHFEGVEGGAPERRMGSGLAHWTELERQSS